jgi:copper(I)-binding protein
MEGTTEAHTDGEMQHDGKVEGGAGTAAVYMLITNNGTHPISLIGGETTVAEAVEVHENIIGENDVMMMRPVEQGIVIPTGETVELRPAGLHVMLVNLLQDLDPQTAFALTLTFDMLDENGASEGETVAVRVAVPVLEMPPIPSDLVVKQVWARPTVSNPNMHGEHSEHAHSEALDATEAPTMDMATPTAPMDGMAHGGRALR